LSEKFLGQALKRKVKLLLFEHAKVAKEKSQLLSRKAKLLEEAANDVDKRTLEETIKLLDKIMPLVKS